MHGQGDIYFVAALPGAMYGHIAAGCRSDLLHFSIDDDFHAACPGGNTNLEGGINRVGTGQCEAGGIALGELCFLADGQALRVPLQL